jgi:hypothetical protein
MAEKTTGGHGGNRKHGRNKVKCAAYASAMTREHHKIKRVARSSGGLAAVKWAQEHCPKLEEYARRTNGEN